LPPETAIRRYIVFTITFQILKSSKNRIYIIDYFYSTNIFYLKSTLEDSMSLYKFSFGFILLLIVAIFALLSCSDNSTDSDNNNNNNNDTPPTGMVLVAGTTFTMGVDSATVDTLDGTISDWPEHQVTVDSFYIDINEVTQAEYKAFVDATGHETPFNNGTSTDTDPDYAWAGNNYPTGLGSHPVVGLDYYDAEAYCQWKGKRLPTEKEWELAARGTDKRLYPWGNVFDQAKCNSNGSGIGATTPVGSYPAGQSPYGLNDMAGNAKEWTSDWLMAYPGNPHEYAPNTYKSMRGGSWDNLDSSDKLANTYSRSANGPTRIDRDAGCRCVQDVN
jgi:formylglycine-generating enzyme required for sulfatase activity